MKKRKHYAKKQTKWHKRTRQNKKHLLLYAMVGVLACVNLQGAYQAVETRQELTRINDKTEITPIIDYVEVNTIDWVMNEVEQAGLDKYKVYALINCESRWDTQATNNNKTSIDMGLWQINSYYHSEVSPICNYEYQCQTKEAIRILKERGYGEWACGNILGL